MKSLANHLTVLSIGFLLIVSCINVDLVTKFDSFDPAKPIKLHSDTSVVIMQDYFPQIDKFDSVSSSDLLIEPYPDFDTVRLILKGKTKLLNTVSAYYMGESATLVALDYSKQNNSNEQAQPKIISISNENDLIKVKILGKNVEYMVLWQNSLIDPFNIETNGNKKNPGKDITLEIKIPSYAKKMKRSYLRIYGADNQCFTNDVLIPLENGVPITETSVLTRKDMYSQVLYSLLIDRFYDGNPVNTKKINSPDVLPKVDYYGGDLEGVLEKMKSGFFSDLGITTIWISPIMQNPYDAWGQIYNPKTKFSGYHGYWPVYITKIDDRFGDEQVLRSLLTEAHNRGINVILDYVAHHMHINSPTLKVHPDWVTPNVTPDGRPNYQLWDEFRLTTWFDKHIPSLDMGKKYVYEPLTDSALFWLKNYDFDGFRHDATKHIPEVYWRTLTSKIRKELPDKNIYQIGETYGSPELIDSYIKNGMLDAQFDFNVYDAMIWSMIDKNGSFVNVHNRLMESLKTYGNHNLMGNITGNHDRPRFISLAGGALKPDEDYKLAGWKRDVGVGDSIAYDKASLLQALIFTIPGIPCIYYGDEYGEPGGNDPDNRRWMRFADYNNREEKLRETVKSLISLRKSSLPLIYGDLFPLSVSKDVFAYMRVYMGQYVLVALNKSDTNVTMELEFPFFPLNNAVETRFGKFVSTDGNKIVIEAKANSFTIVNSI